MLGERDWCDNRRHFCSSPQPPGENRVARSIGSAEKNRVGREPEPQHILGLSTFLTGSNLWYCSRSAYEENIWYKYGRGTGYLNEGARTFLHLLSYLPHEWSFASKRNKSFNIRFRKFAEKYIIDTELEIKLFMLWYESSAFL